jgi:phosphoribosylformimino-5-aminoimidazole carboxamide ribotide isomerase
MEILPAVDLLAGRVVRLEQGRYDAVTIFDENPVERVKTFKGLVPMLHVVDLAGARIGRPVQKELVRLVANEFGPIQLGGGVRTVEAFEAYLELGAERVVLGTAAIKEPELVRSLAEKYPGKVVVGVDAKDGFVATDGWTIVSETTAIDLAKSFTGLPIAAILYTDIARDGMGKGANIEATAKLARDAGFPVIASGGISSADDLRALAACPGITAAIVGRALYDGTLSLADAVAAAKHPS